MSLKKTKQLETNEILILNVNIGGNIHIQIVAKNMESTSGKIWLSL